MITLIGTRSSPNWETQPAKMDVLNLRHTFETSSRWEIPDLRPTSFVPANLAAWNMPRHREYAAVSGGALHFFLDDYRFESVWSSPERLLPRVTAVGAALTPDFSLWRDMPTPAQLWNVYRSRWCGAYWQSQGVEVIPTACWAGPETFDFCFDGIPTESTVAITSMGIRASEIDRSLFRDGVKELISRTNPQLILAYGRLRHCDDIDLPEVREYPTFWDRRRKAVTPEWEDADHAVAPAPESARPKPARPREVQVLDPQVRQEVEALQALARDLARATAVPEQVESRPVEAPPAEWAAAVRQALSTSSSTPE
ncbi:hypothetical protein SEA_STEAMY_1 [Mycobacterium phage Steamy]|uniref:Uncharacterized protein n=1 Tax=Mycobacterium phage Steamy TaxID=2250309 RepID=A0A345L0H6_9CAUD|nr:nuclease [Mycobacterium phage Steamy]AXH48778.1 hypothetical protein SEA_STEAMY_1 [Mycobacterium phage Steamy]